MKIEKMSKAYNEQNAKFSLLVELCAKEYRKSHLFQDRAIAAFTCLDMTNEYLLTTINNLRSSADLNALSSTTFLLYNMYADQNIQISQLLSGCQQHAEIIKS